MEGKDPSLQLHYVNLNNLELESSWMLILDEEGVTCQRAEETENILFLSCCAAVAHCVIHRTGGYFLHSSLRIMSRGFFCRATKRQSNFLPQMSKDDQELDLFYCYEYWVQPSEQDIHSANSEPLQNLLWLGNAKLINDFVKPKIGQIRLETAQNEVVLLACMSRYLTHWRTRKFLVHHRNVCSEWI